MDPSKPATPTPDRPPLPYLLTPPPTQHKRLLDAGTSGVVGSPTPIWKDRATLLLPTSVNHTDLPESHPDVSADERRDLATLHTCANTGQSRRQTPDGMIDLYEDEVDDEIEIVCGPQVSNPVVRGSSSARTHHPNAMQVLSSSALRAREHHMTGPSRAIAHMSADIEYIDISAYVPHQRRRERETDTYEDDEDFLLLGATFPVDQDGHRRPAQRLRIEKDEGGKQLDDDDDHDDESSLCEMSPVGTSAVEGGEEGACSTSGKDAKLSGRGRGRGVGSSKLTPAVKRNLLSMSGVPSIFARPMRKKR